MTELPAGDRGRDTHPVTGHVEDMGLFAALGFRTVEASGERVVLEWDVNPIHHQPYGIIHGGVHCAAVESAASIGAALWLGDRGQVVGVSNHTDFIRSVRDGRLRATATAIDCGPVQQLWLVEIRDCSDRLVARGEVRLQNLGL
jgi:1,4-dihydroxy-2-naphthoyl-CoA hydrolase